MATIIAGVFATMAETEDAQTDLLSAGLTADRISVFALNPPGQHDLYPIGGDEDADRGAAHGHVGAISGAIIGASTGLGVGAATVAAIGAAPVVAVAVTAAAAGVSVYGGSLVGALNRLGDETDAAAAETARHAGIMIAVNVENAATFARAISILQTHGAKQIERAEGEWHEGKWLDFDPRIAPELVGQDAAIEWQSPVHRSMP